MDFVFMLTRADATVLDGLDVLDAVASLGLMHIGFKDVGVDKATLARLNARIHAMGARSYLEVVSVDAERSLESVRNGIEIGVDCVLGGFDVEHMAPLAAHAGIDFLPFPGRPYGHPTLLAGLPEEVASDCRRHVRAGCAGVDLLAYRATQAEPLAMVRAARAALGDAGRLLVAGNIETPTQIRALAAAGVDAFTIGTAVMEGRFSPRKALIRSQLEDVLATLEALVQSPGSERLDA